VFDIVVPTHGLPPSKRQLIMTLLGDKKHPKDIATEAGCSEATVYTYRTNMLHFNEPMAPSISRMGRPKILTEEMMEVQPFAMEMSMDTDGNRTSLEFASERTSVYLDEIVWFLWGEYEVVVSESTVSRVFTKRRWAKKVVFVDNFTF
jgi:hypothetical protein